MRSISLRGTKLTWVSSWAFFVGRHKNQPSQFCFGTSPRPGLQIESMPRGSGGEEQRCSACVRTNRTLKRCRERHPEHHGLPRRERTSCEICKKVRCSCGAAAPAAAGQTGRASSSPADEHACTMENSSRTPGTSRKRARHAGHGGNERCNDEHFSRGCQGAAAGEQEQDRIEPMHVDEPQYEADGGEHGASAASQGQDAGNCGSAQSSQFWCGTSETAPRPGLQIESMPRRSGEDVL